ncbi:MAG: LamG domain-containing protein [Minicystis sp.]
MTCSGGQLSCAQNKQPSAEICDGLDNDCNGVADDGNPGGGLACSTGKPGVCAAGTTACSGGAISCVQNQQAKAEVCDGLDNNCDGNIDEGVKLTFYRDADGDGLGNAANSVQACTAPAGYVANNLDCNDALTTVQTCGGGSCPACLDGAPCNAASDCQSGICTGNVCTSPPQPPTSGRVAYWNLDQAPPTITDFSGNGNTGHVWNATRVTGKVGFGYQFTNNSCITVADSTSLRMAGGNTYTMMAWVNSSAGCSSDRGEFLNKENQYEMGIRCSGNNFDEATWTSTSTWFWTGYGGISLNTWQHVAITWDGTTIRAYSNGALVGTRPLSGTFQNQATGLGLGCRSVPASGAASGSSFFIGKMDEVAIYNRALSAAEISAYYNSTK